LGSLFVFGSFSLSLSLCLFFIFSPFGFQNVSHINSGTKQRDNVETRDIPSGMTMTTGAQLDERQI